VGFDLKNQPTFDAPGGGAGSGGVDPAAIWTALGTLMAAKGKSPEAIGTPEMDDANKLMRIKRLRSMSHEQLAEEPESMEKQIAMQEKEQMGRPEALNPSSIWKALDINRFKGVNPLGKKASPDNIETTVVIDPSIKKSLDKHFSEPGVQSWVRSHSTPQNGGTSVAFEIQKSKEVDKDSEEKAIEAYLQRVTEEPETYNNVGVISPEDAARTQGHVGLYDWVKERYGERYPQIFEEYTKSKPVDKRIEIPMGEKDIENNLTKMAISNLGNKLNSEMNRVGEYSEIPEYDYQKNSRYNYRNRNSEDIPFYFHRANKYSREDKFPRTLDEDTSFGMTKDENFINNKNILMDKARQDVSILIPDKKRSGEFLKNYSSWLDLTRGDELKKISSDTYNSLKYRLMPKTPDGYNYKSFDLQKINDEIMQGNSPWKYFKEKKDNK